MRNRHFLAVVFLMGATLLACGGCAGGDEPRDRDELSQSEPDPSVRLSTSAGDRTARNTRNAANNEPTLGRTSLAFPTGDRRTSVILLESSAPRQVRVGQEYSYTLRVTNLTDAPIHNIEVRDVGAGPSTRPADRDADAPRSGGETWQVGTLGPRESKDRQITGRAAEVGQVRSCMSLTYTPTLCTAITVIKPELAIAASGPSDALICDPLRYRFTVRNTGTGTAEAVRLEATLPEGLTTADGKATVAAHVGDLREGESRDVNIDLKANRIGRYAVRGVARSGELEARSEEVAATVREPVLAIDVEGPEAAYVNEEVTFRVTVRNSGDAPAQRSVLRLSTGGERAQDRDLGTIEAGQSRTLNVTARAGRQAGDMRLSATAEAVCAKGVTDTATVPVRVVPALQIECIDAQDPIRIGGNTVYTISVKNEGSGPDSNVRLRATLPEELEFVSGKGVSQVTADGRTITFAPVPTLAAGQTANWQVEVRAVRPGDARFSLEMTTDSLTKPVMESEPTRVVERGAGAPATRPANGQ